MAIDPELGYRDVLAAWRHYLAHDNQGRGVVLVGHSQGSRMLMQLLQREIEGSPAQALLVSALIPGLNVELPTGRDTGGTFKQLPACGTPAQTGCIVAYASFRADAPPPDNARFGRSRKDGTTVACVDPVALTGGTVQGWLPVRSNLLGQALDVPQWPQWQAMAKALNAPFVALPGLTRARCVADGPNHFLAVSFQAGPDGRRPADLPADILANGKPLADWGLHLVDLNLVGGNLLQLVRQQSAAWVQAHPAAK